MRITNKGMKCIAKESCDSVTTSKILSNKKNNRHISSLR